MKNAKTFILRIFCYILAGTIFLFARLLFEKDGLEGVFHTALLVTGSVLLFGAFAAAFTCVTILAAEKCSAVIDKETK